MNDRYNKNTINCSKFVPAFPQHLSSDTTKHHMFHLSNETTLTANI